MLMMLRCLTDSQGRWRYMDISAGTLRMTSKKTTSPQKCPEISAGICSSRPGHFRGSSVFQGLDISSGAVSFNLSQLLSRLLKMLIPEYLGSRKYPPLFCTDVHYPVYTFYNGGVQELVRPIETKQSPYSPKPNTFFWPMGSSLN